MSAKRRGRRRVEHRRNRLGTCIGRRRAHGAQKPGGKVGGKGEKGRGQGWKEIGNGYCLGEAGRVARIERKSGGARLLRSQKLHGFI